HPVGDIPQLDTNPVTDERIRREVVSWYLRPAPSADTAQLAQQILDSFEQSGQAAMRRTVLRLVAIDPTGPPRATSAAWADIGDGDAWMAETLAERRLLVISGGDGARTVGFRDPAVVEKWSTLEGWIDEDRAFLTWRAGLASALRAWT